MRLDRNITNPRRGKYALLRLREWPHGYSPECQAAFKLLEDADAIDFGDTDDTDFFVIRLKDRYAAKALLAYAKAAEWDNEIEYASDIYVLARKSLRLTTRKPD